MCDIWLSRYTPKFDGSKISHLPMTEYIRHMFTTESPRGNLLIQMQLILSCKVHILVCFFVFESFPIHAGDCWILKKVWMENEELRLLWRVVTFMKCCDFYEKLWLLWKVVTFMKSCHFYEKLWLLWKVVTFMKDDDLSERLWLFQRFVIFLVRYNKNIFSPPFAFYKLRDFLSF